MPRRLNQLEIDLLRRELFDRAGDAHAGGVHQQVESFVPLSVLVDDPATVVLVRNVGGDRECAQLLRCGLDLLARPRGQGQLEAFLLEHARDGEADT